MSMQHGTVSSVDVIDLERILIRVDGRPDRLVVPNCCASQCVEKGHEVEWDDQNVDWIPLSRKLSRLVKEPIRIARLSEEGR